MSDPRDSPRDAPHERTVGAGAVRRSSHHGVGFAHRQQAVRFILDELRRRRGR